MYLWNVNERRFVVRQSRVESLTEGGLHRVVGLLAHGVEPFVQPCPDQCSPRVVALAEECRDGLVRERFVVCFERGLVGGQDGPSERFTRESIVLDKRHGRTQQLGPQRGRAGRHEQRRQMPRRFR